MARRVADEYYRNLEKARSEQYEREQTHLKNRMRANWVGQAGLDERADKRRYKKRFEDLQQESQMVLEMERKAALRKAEEKARIEGNETMTLLFLIFYPFW